MVAIGKFLIKNDVAIEVAIGVAIGVAIEP